MFCPQCGTQLPDESLFCGACGVGLNEHIPSNVARPGAPSTDASEAPAFASPSLAAPAATSAAPVPAPTYVPSQHTIPTAATAASAPVDDRLAQLAAAGRYKGPTGVKWSFRDIIRGKTMRLLFINLILWMVILGIVAIVSLQSESTDNIIKFFSLIPAGIADITSGTEYAASLKGLLVLILALGALVITFMPTAFVVMLWTNAREKNVVATPESRLAHEQAIKFRWHFLYTVIVGLIAFLALQLIIAHLIARFAIFAVTSDWINMYYIPAGYFDALASIFALAITERIIRPLNRRRIAKTATNEALIAQIELGECADEIPEKYRDPISIAQIISLLKLGVVYSIKGAVRIIKLVNIHDQLARNNAFIMKSIDIVVSFVTLTTSELIMSVLDEASDDYVDDVLVRAGLTPTNKKRTFPRAARIAGGVATIVVAAVAMCGLLILDANGVSHPFNKITFSDVRIINDYGTFFTVRGTITNTSTYDHVVYFDSYFTVGQGADAKQVRLQPTDSSTGGVIAQDSNSDDIGSTIVYNIKANTSRELNFVYTKEADGQTYEPPEWRVVDLESTPMFLLYHGHLIATPDDFDVQFSNIIDNTYAAQVANSSSNKNVSPNSSSSSNSTDLHDYTVTGYILNKTDYTITSGWVWLAATNENGRLIIDPPTNEKGASVYWLKAEITDVKPGEAVPFEAKGQAAQNIAAVKYVDVSFKAEVNEQSS